MTTSVNHSRGRHLKAAFVMLSAVLLSGCVWVDMASLLSPSLEEVTLQKAERFTLNKILLVDIRGFIASQPPGRFYQQERCVPDAVKAALNKAEQDERIKAVILRIDTPGGGVTATDMIHHEIRAFKERTGRPVVAAIMGVGCSGGYYIANAADRIYAHPTSVTGSIGVLACFPDLHGLAGKVGYEQTVIKSGPMKDMGNPLRTMPEEEQAIFQQMVDTMYGQFLDRVVAGRSGFTSREQLKPVADGRIYTARQALELKLIDRIAYLDEVIREVKREAGLRDAHVVAYQRGLNDDATIYSAAAAPRGLPGMVNVDLSALLGSTRAGFYYLWQPGGAATR